MKSYKVYHAQTCMCMQTLQHMAPGDRVATPSYIRTKAPDSKHLRSFTHSAHPVAHACAHPLALAFPRCWCVVQAVVDSANGLETASIAEDGNGGVKVDVGQMELFQNALSESERTATNLEVGQSPLLLCTVSTVSIVDVVCGDKLSVPGSQASCRCFDQLLKDCEGLFVPAMVCVWVMIYALIVNNGLCCAAGGVISVNSSICPLVNLHPISQRLKA